MQRLEIKKGTRFGRLTIIKEVEKYSTYRMFLTRCDCGNQYTARLSHLRRMQNPVRSCGCLREIPYAQTHGRSRTPVYNTWCGMKRRCENVADKSYRDYGGRGIKVCERWQQFENFLADMGERPSIKHEIDRIDNDGNYQPGNVRWVTRQQHARNKRKQSGTKSQYRGVDFWNNERWRARLVINGKLKHIGMFDSEREAAEAYDEVARPLGFHVNFPQRS